MNNDLKSLEIDQSLPKNFKSEKLIDFDLINKFNSIYNQRHITNKSYNNIEFNINNMTLITKIDDNTKILFVNQIGFDPSKNSNFGYFVALTNGELHTPYITKTSKINDDLFEISYDENMIELLTIQLIPSVEHIEITYDYYNVEGFNQKIMNGCGYATMDCISDIYTNHGWVSVCATVQTAFIPETAAALTMICAANECL